MASTIKHTVGSRTARYRRRRALLGARRVEVTVPAQDVELVRRLATDLRKGGGLVERLRAMLNASLAFSRRGPVTNCSLSSAVRLWSARI